MRTGGLPETWTSPRSRRVARAAAMASLWRPVRRSSVRYVSVAGRPPRFQPAVARTSTIMIRSSVSLSSGRCRSIRAFGTFVHPAAGTSWPNLILGMAVGVRG